MKETLFDVTEAFQSSDEETRRQLLQAKIDLYLKGRLTRCESEEN